jgi:solute carrier family 25 carnitine/acylcarnitine transporter 20/29
MRNTYVKEGALAFYKGMEFPLIAVPIINACVFTSYEFWKRILETDDIAPMEYWKV